MLTYDVYLASENDFIDPKKEQQIRTLFREQLGVDVSFRFESVPPDERDELAQPFGYLMHIEFQQDLPPDINILVKALHPVLRQITGVQAIGANFIDVARGPFIPNCIALQKTNGSPFEQADLDALKHFFKEKDPNISVEFLNSSHVLCKGITLENAGDMWDELQDAVGAELGADRVNRSMLHPRKPRGRGEDGTGAART